MRARAVLQDGMGIALHPITMTITPADAAFVFRAIAILDGVTPGLWRECEPIGVLTFVGADTATKQRIHAAGKDFRGGFGMPTNNAMERSAEFKAILKFCVE